MKKVSFLYFTIIAALLLFSKKVNIAKTIQRYYLNDVLYFYISIIMINLISYVFLVFKRRT